MCKEKTPGELLAEELFYRTKNAGEELDAAELARADAFCEEYKTFLDHAKIEREAVRTTVAMLEKAGYTAFDPDRSYQPGDRIYRNVRGKALILATIGTEDLEKGVRMVISHIDSPRLDLSPIRSMRTAVWHSSRPTTMAASRSISGLPCRWLCTVPWCVRTAPCWM